MAASVGRMYPVLWWNWVTLAVTAVLFGLIAASFVGQGRLQVPYRAGSGSAGEVAAVGALALTSLLRLQAAGSCRVGPGDPAP